MFRGWLKTLRCPWKDACGFQGSSRHFPATSVWAFHLTCEGFGSVPGKVTESKQIKRKKKSPVIWPSSSLSTILVSPQICKQPAPTTRRGLVFTGELRLHLLKISIETVLTSDLGKGTRLKKGCSKLRKAKLFACWFVWVFFFLTWQNCMAPLFLSNCPRNLTAWSCCGKTRDTMQVFTVAKMIEDSSLPDGSFGTVAPSCTDRKNLWLYSLYAALGLCIMRNEIRMEWSEFQAGSNWKRKRSKSNMLVQILFNSSYIFQQKKKKPTTT